MSVAPLSEENYPQFGIMADDLPDPYASLDVDMADDPGPDVHEAENMPAGAAESPEECATREHEEALAPHLAKYLPSLEVYEERALALLGSGEPTENPDGRAAWIAEQAEHMRREDEVLARHYAEEDLREARVREAMKARREQSTTREDDER